MLFICKFFGSKLASAKSVASLPNQGSTNINIIQQDTINNSSPIGFKYVQLMNRVKMLFFFFGIF